jgi:hypothetical protein
VVSKTGTVEFGGRGFWAYDVSLSIMLVETIRVGEELPSGQRPSWLSDALDQLRVLAVVSDLGFVIDMNWPTDGVDLLITLIAEANRRLAARGTITAVEVATWNVLDGDTIDLRGAQVVDLAPVVELGQAMIQLVQGTLPPAPGGTWWLYGFAAGPRMVAMREPT